MTIVVRRRTNFAVTRRFQVKLDGRTVARLGRGRTVELTGSGTPQELTVSIDWVGSNPLAVVDPGPASVLDIEVVHHGMADSLLRTWLAPKSVLVLVPAGRPAPPPPPLRLEPRKVVRSWLVVAAGTAVGVTLLSLATDHTVDLAGVTGAVVGVSIAFGLFLAAAAVILRRRGARR